MSLQIKEIVDSVPDPTAPRQFLMIDDTGPRALPPIFGSWDEASHFESWVVSGGFGDVRLMSSVSLIRLHAAWVTDGKPDHYGEPCPPTRPLPEVRT